MRDRICDDYGRGTALRIIDVHRRRSISDDQKPADGHFHGEFGLMYKYVIRAEISDLKELYEVCKELMPKARFFYYRWSEDNYLKWHKLPEVGDVSNLRFSRLLFFLRLYAFEQSPFSVTKLAKVSKYFMSLPLERILRH
ncbi:MAG: hypothetical protein J0L72_10310 [Armatimonadetes bacterium]|nr:hypothetical protein [Armatimonadota bacterium]